MTENPNCSLISSLEYEPQPLKFGTSGRRGDVRHLTQLEIYINATAELEYLLSLPRAEGGIVRGEDFYFAYDLRPSSTVFVPEQGGRGEIAQAIERAIRDAGMRPVNLGHIPAPALASYALDRSCGSMMVTGSHIPFERNGYKTNTARGELLKKDEIPIGKLVMQVRRKIYAQEYSRSPFDRQGRFKCGHIELSTENDAGRQSYIQRYCRFYPGTPLHGKRLLVYQHSAVGRDLLVEILQQLGAEALPAGRSNTFVPIDTENIDREQLAIVRQLACEIWRDRGPFDAVVSTDGDSDRPLILGVEPADPCRVRFQGGDLVGMIVAMHLHADAVVVPISCNDAIDLCALAGVLEPKTRIGSPYVIAGMEKALAKGRKAVCGWEANGGFLTGSDFHRSGGLLRALPTRDAVLPILAVLAEMCVQGKSAAQLFQQLPKRFSRAALLKNFPRPVSDAIIAGFTPRDAAIKEVAFESAEAAARNEEGERRQLSATQQQELSSIRARASRFFTPELDFEEIVRINYTDGVRFYFRNGDVAHVRPSGNADELRIYAVADTQERADAIALAGVAEPEGILRKMGKAGDGERQKSRGAVLDDTDFPS